MHTIFASSHPLSWSRRSTAIMLCILLLAALPLSAVFAAETEYFPPSTVTATGRNAWVNPSYIISSDNQYASTAQNKVMKLTNFNIAPIAGDSTINGISVAVEGYTAGGRQVKVQVSGNNGVTWSAAYTSDLAGSESVRTLGGASNLWGFAWTPAQFANGSFAVRVTPVGAKTAGTVYLDQLTVKVHYTPNGIPITVEADPQTRHYGYPDPLLTYQVTEGSLLPGDSFTGNLLRDPGETPGTYLINKGSLDATGYIITYVPNNLTIDQAPLTVTAPSFKKLSGEADITAFDPIYTGFVFGEDATDLTTAPACALPPGTDQTVPGVYPITCSGGASDNYTFTYVDGTLTVKAENHTATDIVLSASVLEENHLAGFAVGTLTNDDPDPDTFTYTLCGGIDDGFFTIDGDTLKTAVLLNYENKSSYGICIMVDDGFTGGSFTENFIVTLTDLPETFYSLAGQDGWILESTETGGTGGTRNYSEPTFRLGDETLDRQYRSILAFRTTTLPDNAVVTGAVLRIRRESIVGTNPFVTHKYLVADIRKGFFGTYVLQLADFKSTASLNAAGVFGKTATTTGWYRSALKTTALPKINTTGVTQFRLRFQLDDNDDLGADYVKFYSGNSLLPNRPVLVLQYYLP